MKAEILPIQSWRPDTYQAQLSKYASALLWIALASLLTVLLRPYLQGTPAMLLVAGIILSRICYGLGPGLIAYGVAICTFAFYAPPMDSLAISPPYRVMLLLIVVVGLLVNLLWTLPEQSIIRRSSLLMQVNENLRAAPD